MLPEWHGWHAARRGLGTNLYRLGVPEKTIQALRYANVSPKWQRSATPKAEAPTCRNPTRSTSRAQPRTLASRWRNWKGSSLATKPHSRGVRAKERTRHGSCRQLTNRETLRGNLESDNVATESRLAWPICGGSEASCFVRLAHF